MASHTPLAPYHENHAKRIIDFHGWRMPLYYSGILQEHRAVRKHVGVFDVSHMGDLLLVGEGVRRGLERAVPSRPPSPGAARYTHLLRSNGTIVDDVMVLGLDRERYLCVCNAGKTTDILTWLRRHVAPPQLRDLTHDVVCLAVQGPESEKALEGILTEGASGLQRFHGGFVRVRGEAVGGLPPEEAEGWGSLRTLLEMRPTRGHDEVYVTRTGYTGEDGFEIYADGRLGAAVWESLMRSGVPPAGLGARDTLRLEKGYLLSGQDFDGDRTPLEAGYEWIVDWEHEFVGREALLHQKRRGAYDRFRGVRLDDRGVPRRGSPVLQHGVQVGSLTSGSLSPTLGVGVGLGYLEPAASAPGLHVEVEVRGRRLAAEVARLPLL